VSVADIAEPEHGSYAAALDEQAQCKGVHPIASVDELCADVSCQTRNWRSSWLTWRPSGISTWLRPDDPWAR